MFEWNSAFETGIGEIDEQHQELFNIGEQVNQLLVNHSGNDNYDDITECLERLAAYTVYHFNTEEELFEKYDYADREEHIKEHRAFIEHLESLDLTHIDSNQEQAVKDLLKFIALWIFKHINNSDFKYSDYLKRCMGISA